MCLAVQMYQLWIRSQGCVPFPVLGSRSDACFIRRFTNALVTGFLTRVFSVPLQSHMEDVHAHVEPFLWVSVISRP